MSAMDEYIAFKEAFKKAAESIHAATDVMGVSAMHKAQILMTAICRVIEEGNLDTEVTRKAFKTCLKVIEENRKDAVPGHTSAVWRSGAF